MQPREATGRPVAKGKSVEMEARYCWGFPKIRGTFFGDPHNQDYSIWGLYWGPLILGNYLFRI